MAHTLFDTYDKEPPPHLSVSQMRKFRLCGVQFFFSYLTKLPSKPGDRMLLGNGVHAGLAQANYLRRDGAPLEEGIINDSAVSEVEKLVNKHDYTFGEWNDPDGVKRQTVKVLNRSVPMLESETGHPMLVEHPVGDPALGGTSISFESGHFFKGYVDLVDVNGSIYDFKVGAKAKTQGDVDQDLQLSLYGYAIAGIDGDPLRVSLVSVNSKTGDVKRVDSKRTGGQREQAFDIMNDTAKMMKVCTDNHIFYPATEGWHCGPRYCDFWKDCPYGGLR